MCAPLDLQHHVVRRDSAFIAFISDALVVVTLLTLDELGSGEPASRLDRAAEFAIDDATHSFEDAAQEAFRQCFLALVLYSLLILEPVCGIVSVSHELAMRVFS